MVAPGTPDRVKRLKHAHHRIIASLIGDKVGTKATMTEVHDAQARGRQVVAGNKRYTPPKGHR